ncbi:MAG: hypothetical protein A2Z02_05720, partial [Chloroflexi bacterium RBG_16_48_7]
MYRFIATNIFAPALDLARGTRTMKCLDELNKSQWWPADRITELQNQRLRALVNYAYENVPYYRRILDGLSLKPDDIETIADLAKLPLLNKAIIRENSAGLLSKNYPASRRLTMHTGGSTGEPLTFFRTREDQQDWGFAAGERSFQWAGYSLGDKRALINVIRPYSSRTDMLYQKTRDFFKRTIQLDAKKLAAQTLPEYVKKLHKFQPRFIQGYPAALEMVAHFIQEKPEYEVKPGAIVCGGEQLYGYQRELFGRVFKCGVFRYYSSWELHSIASECKEHSGLHISAENVIVEVVDENGKPVDNGNRGKILITSLHNFAMPFIRYE